LDSCDAATSGAVGCAAGVGDAKDGVTVNRTLGGIELDTVAVAGALGPAASSSPDFFLP
jgi:hypothetical protein